MWKYGLRTVLLSSSVAGVVLLAGFAPDSPMAPVVPGAGQPHLALHGTMNPNSICNPETHPDCPPPPGGGGNGGGSSSGELSVTVVSPDYNRNVPGLYTLNASVSGGVGPYTYYWRYNICYDDGTCTGWEGFQDGVGVSSVTIESSSNMTEEQYDVQVGDAHTIPYTAWSERTLIGPSHDMPAFDPCTSYDSQYPWMEYDGSGYLVYYRYDVCTGEIVYQP